MQIYIFQSIITMQDKVYSSYQIVYSVRLTKASFGSWVRNSFNWTRTFCQFKKGEEEEEYIAQLCTTWLVLGLILKEIADDALIQWNIYYLSIGKSGPWTIEYCNTEVNSSYIKEASCSRFTLGLNLIFQFRSNCASSIHNFFPSL